MYYVACVHFFPKHRSTLIIIINYDYYGVFHSIADEFIKQNKIM